MSIFDVPNTIGAWVESRVLPRWLQADEDWVSWIQHLLWALAFTGAGALFGWVFGMSRVGAQIGSLVALAFFVAREASEMIEYRGSKWFDGIMDTAGPALVAWIFW